MGSIRLFSLDHGCLDPHTEPIHFAEHFPDLFRFRIDLSLDWLEVFSTIFRGLLDWFGRALRLGLCLVDFLAHLYDQPDILPIYTKA
jgi:hypothetical protein